MKLFKRMGKVGVAGHICGIAKLRNVSVFACCAADYVACVA